MTTFADKSGNALTYYASVVTPSNTGTSNLNQLGGRTFAYSDPASTSGAARHEDAALKLIDRAQS